MSSFAQSAVVPCFKNILFATDFSPCSEAAHPYLRDIAEHFGGNIHVVHVVRPEPDFEVPMDVIVEMESDMKSARDALREIVANKEFGDASVTWTAERGPFWPVIEQHIKDEKIDLIVLGTHGRRGLKKMILGSVAEEVFRMAPCPVLTVGPMVPKETPLSHANILFATDFSEGSEHAMTYAVEMARTYNAHLIVLHAVEVKVDLATDFNVGAATMEVSSALLEAALKGARTQMDEFLSPRMIYEMNPEVMVECGPSAETILRIAEEKKADLIVMGAHRSKQHELVTHLPWATASAVVRQAHCPVLTVRS